MSTLRLATLNIWHTTEPWAKRLRLIRREVERLRPAVLGLQEVVRRTPEGQPPRGPEDCQAMQIADGLGYAVAYGAATHYGGGRDARWYGNAVLSSMPIRQEQVFRLPGEHTGESRCLLYALIDTPFGDLPVFVTHLNWRLNHGAVRLEQVRFIVSRIEELAPLGGPMLPPVLLGDLNAEPDSDEIRFLRGLAVVDAKSTYFADAWTYGGDGSRGATFDPVNDYARRTRHYPRRIDYVLVRGPDRFLRGEPLHTELAFTTPETHDGTRIWPSDHFGVVTDVVFDRREPSGP